MLTPIRTSISARELAGRKPVALTADQALQVTERDLNALGVHGFTAAMDSALVGPAGASGATREQFLQVWLPGIVRQATQVRDADRLTGLTEAGNWYDETVIIRTLAEVGKAELYGDSSNVPLANYSHSDESRGIIRFEQGFEVTNLAEAREGAGGINMAAEKRGAATTSLEISRNRVGFYGYVTANTRTFGILNDPGLPAYTSAAKTYPTMTYDELVAEIAAQFAAIETSSGGNINQRSNFVIALPTGYSSVFTKPNTMGETATSWLNANYPNVRIEYSPELVAANGGANVAYYWAESIEDGSTDGGSAWTQVVPAKFFNIGSERRVKGYIEDFGCATAGVIVKRPYLFRRRTGA